MKGKIKLVVGLLFAAAVVVQATPITNGLYIELVADNLGLANGASVDTWADTQGNATLVKGNNDPLFVAANADFNGHATVNFNYNSQLVDTTLGGTIPSTENLTLFMVAKYNTVHNSNEWLYRSQTAGASRLRVFHSTSNYGYQMRTQVGSGGAVTPGNNTVNTDLRLYTISSGSDVVNFDIISAAGTLSATGGNGTGIALGEIVLGSAGAENNYADANIAEVLVYDHALTATEIDQVNAYLVAKYAIPEPATLGLVLLMGGGLFYARRRRIMR